MVMNRMYQEMVVQKNVSDVSFLILNMKRAKYSINQLIWRVSQSQIPVYQEPHDQDIMGLLNGKKDDMLIYDRCGCLVDHFSLPYSNLMRSQQVRRSLECVINRESERCTKNCPKTTLHTTSAPASTVSTNQTTSKDNETMMSQRPTTTGLPPATTTVSTNQTTSKDPETVTSPRPTTTGLPPATTNYDEREAGP